VLEYITQDNKSMTDKIFIGETITTNTTVHLIDENKTYKLHELKNVLACNRLYTIELIETNYTLDNFLQIADIFLLSDLIKIIYEYLINRINLNMNIGTKNSALDVFFLSEEYTYNFFSVNSFLNLFNIYFNHCPVITRRMLMPINKFSKPTSIKCSCTPFHYSFSTTGNFRDSKIVHNKEINCDIEILCAMYKIFKCLKKTYY